MGGAQLGRTQPPGAPRQEQSMRTQSHCTIEAVEPRRLMSATPVGTEFQVNEESIGAQSVQAVAVDKEGNSVVVFAANEPGSDAADIFARRFNAKGQPLGDHFRVNTFTAGSQLNPALAIDRNGDFVV